MNIAKIPPFLSRSVKSLTWKIPANGKEVYLTFDDGPTPVVTEWVLDLLDEYQAKGTFFCLGNNVESRPEIYQKILSRGHGAGNHSYSHLKGFSTGKTKYMEDIDRAAGLIH